MRKYFLSIFMFGAALLLLAATYSIFKPDYSKSKVAFRIKNAGINVNGSFDAFECTIQFNEEANAPNAIHAVIDVQSIHTGIEARDKHLCKEEYFNAVVYPHITFESTKILKHANGNFIADGNLTIRNVTKAVQIPFTYKGNAAGGVFQGEVKLNRRDYKVGGSSLTMSDDVTAVLTITAAPK